MAKTRREFLKDIFKVGGTLGVAAIIKLPEVESQFESTAIQREIISGTVGDEGWDRIVNGGVSIRFSNADWL